MYKIRAISFGNIVTPSSRYRLLQLIPLLLKSNISVEVKTNKEISKTLTFFDYIFRAKFLGINTFWVQKKVLSIFRVWLISRSNKLIYDFDDAIWTSEKNNRSKLTTWRATFRLNYILRKSNLVIAGNNFLAEYARRFAKNVIVLPTVVDVHSYPLKSHSNGKIFALGWIGQSVNFKYLENLSPVFLQLQSLIKFKLIVVADKDFYLDGIDVENRRWSLESEVSDILDMDVGLMPLDDTEWTKGKCAFKAIQYMASGIPPIASCVGANIELINSGKNGFLPVDQKEWISNILSLAESSDLRTQIGISARKVVEERYSLEYIENQLCHALDDLRKS